MLADHDILWLQTVPSIAAIYYHTYLESTHVLFCPDDRKQLDDLTVRNLGRSILNIANSNNKKVAVHFMRPCSVRKHQDVLRFLYKMRPGLAIKCMILPIVPIQASLLAGWAMALGDVPQRDLWIRRCLVPYSEDAFNSPTDSAERITEYSQPFCITNNEFFKRALIVNITMSMCTSKSERGLVLNEGVIEAIQGWADVVRQQSLPGTIILIADEKTIFKGITDIPGDAQDWDLQRHRDSTHRFLEKLCIECPIYLYTRDYKGTTRELPMQKIASILHRHHLWLSGSFVINWSREESGLEKDCPEFLSGMHRFYLADALVQKSRAIWKNELLEILQRKSEEVRPDNIKNISPWTINSDFSVKDEALTPLLHSPSNKLTREETYMGIVRQSVSATNAQVFESWKAQMRHNETQRAGPEPMKSIIFEDEGSKSTEKPSDDLLDDEEAISELRYSFADLIDNEIIENYIDNKGAYKRGEGIIDKIDDMRMTGNANNIDIWAKARGTAPDPYDVSMGLILQSKKGIEFRDGHCSCPVGRKGRCKHCTALLLRFMVNTDEFEYVSRSQQPQPSIQPSISINKPSSSATPAKTPSTMPVQNPSSTTVYRQPSSEPIENSKDICNSDIFIIEPQSSIRNRTPTNEERESSSDIELPKIKRILPWQVRKNDEPKPTRKRAPKKEPGGPKKPAAKRKKKEESDQDEVSDAQPAKAQPGKPKISTSREKKVKKESEDDDYFEIDSKKLATSKRTVTRRKKVITGNDEDDDDDGEFQIKSRRSTPRKSLVKMETSEDEDDDGFEIKPRKSTPRRAATRSKAIVEVSEDEDDDDAWYQSANKSNPSPFSPVQSTSPSITFDSFPRDTPQIDEEADSDATDDGLGVVYRRSNTGSQMSLDRSSLAKTSSLSDIEMATSGTENKTDMGKIQTLHSEAMTTDDLFDELGL
ncbi:hypothetical protein BJV82DRAFT_672434 [Fennellomyces sp. T-0311]|nr:hypothetical protein BJV82DRAFT_672434 [Fennellomyces sp. T-0311]